MKVLGYIFVWNITHVPTKQNFSVYQRGIFEFTNARLWNAGVDALDVSARKGIAAKYNLKYEELQIKPELVTITELPPNA